MIFFLHLEPVNVNDNNYKVNIAWNLVEIRNMTRLNLNFNYICGFTEFSTKKYWKCAWYNQLYFGKSIIDNIVTKHEKLCNRKHLFISVKQKQTVLQI